MPTATTKAQAGQIAATNVAAMRAFGVDFMGRKRGYYALPVQRS
ncbi:MAG: hypothetical protein ABJB74_03830 [Gemmatimonas sp.]